MYLSVTPIAGFDRRDGHMHRLLRRLQAWSERHGLDVRRSSPLGYDVRRTRLIEKAGVTVVLDVGANDGTFGRVLRKRGYKGRIVSFEPGSAAFAGLQSASRYDESWQSHRLAIGSTDGEAVLNISANSSSSSLLPMEDRHLGAAPESAYSGIEVVRMARLDSLVGRAWTTDALTYLKIDVQGCEMDVLLGAGEWLKRAALIEVELSVLSLYAGQTLYTDMLAYVRDRGYELAGVSEVLVDPSSSRLLQFDAVFARQESTSR